MANYRFKKSAGSADNNGKFKRWDIADYAHHTDYRIPAIPMHNAYRRAGQHRYGRVAIRQFEYTTDQ
jgi:hypothetical protein